MVLIGLVSSLFLCSSTEFTELNHAPAVDSTPPPRKILRSSFVSDNNLVVQSPRVLPSVEVRFKKTACIIADGSGAPTLLEESPVITGFLESNTLDLCASERGSTKDVFVVSRVDFAQRFLIAESASNIQLRAEGKTYAAKKLVNIGNGRSRHIPIVDATNNLAADLIRLKRMAYFANKFQSRALDRRVDIAGEA